MTNTAINTATTSKTETKKNDIFRLYFTINQLFCRPQFSTRYFSKSGQDEINIEFYEASRGYPNGYVYYVLHLGQEEIDHIFSVMELASKDVHDEEYGVLTVLYTFVNQNIMDESDKDRLHCLNQYRVSILDGFDCLESKR